MAPALMAGNVVVVKPPSQGAVSALHMIQTFHKAGFPPGVVQCVTGQTSIPDAAPLHAWQSIAESMYITKSFGMV